MYDQEKIIFYKRVGIGISIVIVAIAGFLVGNTVSTNNTTQETAVTTVVPATLSAERVNEFLLAYYTKKDLSENRDRYQSLMTTALYNQITAEEDLPINQAYKGYTVDQVFDHATIYIDSEHSSAIAQVEYHNTLLQKKGSKTGALENNKVRDTIRITFTKDKDGAYLANKLEYIILDENKAIAPTNTYRESTTSSESTTDSSHTSSSESTTSSSSSQQTETLKGGLKW